MTTFVTVGNATQPFSRLLIEVKQLAIVLPKPVVVQHGNTPFVATGCLAAPFFSSREFVTYVERATVLIMHAGAGSIIHAVNAGKTPIVMPRRQQFGEHVDDHQLEFALALSTAGKVIVALEADDLRGAVAKLPASSYARVHTTPRIIGLVAEVIDRISGQKR
jgi:UDP-N-acetylglucosamine transferase subunit ALG13